MKKMIRDITEPKLLSAESPFAIREAFNQLRTNLMYAVADEDDKGCSVFAVTSYNENTGKSTIIANLAISFAQLNKKVLLVDADMRCPVIHEHFELDENTQGLSELISGISNDVTVRSIRENLDLITSGRIPPNPSELLTSNRFATLIEEWKNKYDVVFIDFPPIGVVTDAMANFKSMTGYIFTIRSGKSSVKRVTSAIDSMERLGAKIVGVVLNDYDIKGTAYRRSRRYGKHGKYGKYGRYNKANSKYVNSAKKSAEKDNGCRAK